MITAEGVVVKQAAANKIGDFTNVYVTISNQGGHTVYLGNGSGVTASNGFPLPSGAPPLALGRVTGTLWGLADTADNTIGLIISSAE